MLYWRYHETKEMIHMKRLALLVLTAALWGLALFALAEGAPIAINSPETLAAITKDPQGD